MAKINKNLNYYKILNVSWDSDKQTMKKSYRDLSKKFHPDKNNGDNTLFNEIAQAYEILTNDELRLEYDTISQFGKSYDETLELYNFEFSNDNVSDDKYRKDLDKFKKKEMVDILIKMKEFKDVISYERYISCKTCDSTGMNFDDHLAIFECDLCDGSGEWKNNTCHACRGKGEISIKKCGSCDGEKIIEITERIKLNLDNFNDDGKCKIEFKGNASKIEVGKVGNLYVMISP